MQHNSLDQNEGKKVSMAFLIRKIAITIMKMAI